MEKRKPTEQEKRIELVDKEEKKDDKDVYNKPVWLSPAWHNVVGVKLVFVKAESTFLKAVKLVMDNDISIFTYPKKKVVNNSSFSGIETETGSSEYYTASEFLELNPILFKLAQEVKKSPQPVFITVNVSEFMDKTYYRLGDKQFKQMYWKPFYPNDNSLMNCQILDFNKKNKELEL